MAQNNKKLTSIISTIFSISFLLLLSIPTTKSQEETDNQKEFSYDIESNIGPDHWGEIHEDWAMCGNGHMQSPIDVWDERVQVMPQLGELCQSYKASDAVLHNRGHDIMLKWEGEAGSLWINGTAYNLLQLHWHSPSEHSINGHRYSLEMHMVHQSTENKIAVVGILFKIGQPDPFLSMLEPSIEKIAKRHEEEEKVGAVDASKVKANNISYYRYNGSLTTPPCTEGVTWTIERKVRTVSRKQVKLLQDAVHDDATMNARPLQPINQRIVDLYLSRSRGSLFTI